jgi:hypothetical protein
MLKVEKVDGVTEYCDFLDLDTLRNVQKKFLLILF